MGSNGSKVSTGTIVSGLSGNEIFCVRLLGFAPGNMVLGNSVFSMGVLGGIKTSLKAMVGGEVKSYTDMIAEGRRLSLQRLEAELIECDGIGAIGVNSNIAFQAGNIEFMSVGSVVHSNNGNQSTPFTTPADGKSLYCQIDAGFNPIRLVFGNVAYSIGFGKNVTGSMRKVFKGEVRQYSDIFNTTRNLALERIVNEAQSTGANSVINIRTTIIPIETKSMHEMMMIGTASFNSQLSEVANSYGIITSDLSSEETWGVINQGYVPLRMVLGTSVYSLGVLGGWATSLRNLVRGEMTEITEMLYGAREESLCRLRAQAEAINADMVLGVKSFVYQLGGGLVEFLSIGTAVKKYEYVTTTSSQLPPQSVMPDRESFINSAEQKDGLSLTIGSSRLG